MQGQFPPPLLPTRKCERELNHAHSAIAARVVYSHRAEYTTNGGAKDTGVLKKQCNTSSSSSRAAYVEGPAGPAIAVPLFLAMRNAEHFFVA